MSRISSGGLHPWKIKAQESLNPDRFVELVEQLPLMGEVGLDSGSSEPIELAAPEFPHCPGSRSQVFAPGEHPQLPHHRRGLVELRRTPVPAPILHWWTGSVAETRGSGGVGCYFSIHSAVARHSKFRSAVPRKAASWSNWTTAGTTRPPPSPAGCIGLSI